MFKDLLFAGDKGKPMYEKQKPRGRPPQYVLDEVTGKPIVGLSYDKNNHQFFNTHFKNEGGERINFGSDYQTAVIKYREYLLKQAGNPYISVPAEQTRHGAEIIIPQKVENPDLSVEQVISMISGSNQSLVTTDPNNIQPNDIQVNPITAIDEIVLWRECRKLIARDRQKAQKMLGIRILVEEDEIAETSVTLTDVWNNFECKPKYQNKAMRSIRTEFNDAKGAWEKFKAVIGKELVADILKSDIRRYFDYTLQYRLDNDLSPSWNKHQYQKIRWLLQMAINDMDHVTYLDRLKTFCDILKPPRGKNKTNAKVITPEDFKKIMDSSKSSLEKALWAVSLNGGYYKIDCISLPRSSVDLDKGLISGFARTKTSEPRCFWIWDETKIILDQYIKENPHDGEFFFFNKELNKPYTEKQVYRKFQQTLKRADMESRYNHSHFRDSFETVAKEQAASLANGVAYNIQSSINAVMGHQSHGMDSHYTATGIVTSLAKVSCQLVHDFYFPPPQSKGTEKPKETDANKGQ
jgi:integrase